ncbi:hypothetical protein F4780DRAFT_566146 [Xylariomycetidae sp. FL0641]|nr:hypothetical protein F4780DRAFT_566146 [Xylariomycetidae sp. FL0641]
MSSVEGICYSRDEVISVIRIYYHFLTKLYLDESEVVSPPSEGWPTIANLRCMGKTDEVIELLKHLPYIQRIEDDGAQAAPGCHFADWRQLSCAASPESSVDGQRLRLCSEPPELLAKIPPHVIGLTYGGRSNPSFLLDTQRGIVHWHECDGRIRHNLDGDPNWVMPATDLDDPFDWAPEAEAEWRAEHPAWAVADFFGILRDQFRTLKYVPVSARRVLEDDPGRPSQETSAMISAVRDVYRAHGWPDTDRYRKAACLESVMDIVQGRLPERADEPAIRVGDANKPS